MRGHEWLPKLQQNTKALVAFEKENFNVFYRFDYLDETIENYNDIVDENYNSATQTTNPSANDEIFTNKRFYHHLNSTGNLFSTIAYNVSVSYQEQTKELERYTYRIRTGEKENMHWY